MNGRTARRSWRLAPTFLLIAAGLVALSACASRNQRGICPRVAIVDQLSTLTRFAPGGPQTPDNVMFRAEISDVKITCEYVGAELNLPRSIDADVEANVVIHRGPAMRGDRARFQYFVLITDRRGTILNKKVYTANVRLTGARTRYEIKSAQSYDMRRGGTGLRFETWLGFQVNDQEREFNRRRRGS